MEVDGVFYCSCNGNLCGHAIKVLLDRPLITYKER
eukprot:jgi/Antlo1/2323/735